jgi:hypothetical protein
MFDLMVDVTDRFWQLRNAHARNLDQLALIGRSLDIPEPGIQSRERGPHRQRAPRRGLTPVSGASPLRATLRISSVSVK